MFIFIAALVATSQQDSMAKLDEVPFTAVKINDGFWKPRIEINRTDTIPHALDMIAQVGDLHNMELAAQGARTGFQGYVFQDSDIYKVIETASYSLASHPDPQLEVRLDGIIAKLAAAQMPDGYLDSYYEINAPDKRWSNLRDNHELYCAGHLFEAAVAHHRATGKTTLLTVARRLADHIERRFGDGPGQKPGYPGHPEIELALVKLWKDTGDRRYFELAKHFIDHRGEGYFAVEHGVAKSKYDGTYWLANVPIREQNTMVGHAVRAGYLMSGATDVARETGDPGLLAMLDRVWKNTTDRRMYVTGGIGSSGSNEGFTEDYDLPNLTAYQETCASVAMAMWNHRMNLLYGDAKYADLMELALYNGVLAGVSLDGKAFFYGNPLESTGGYGRSKWFGCACCPPNASRTLSSLGGYAYATGRDQLAVNLFIQGAVSTKVSGRQVDVGVTTRYPWDGKVQLALDPKGAQRFVLKLRRPGWCENASVQVNGTTVAVRSDRGYLCVDRTWIPGDRVDLSLSMPIRRLAANPRVTDDVGKLALARGPLVYCLESADNPGELGTISIPANAKVEAVEGPKLLGGLVGIVAGGERAVGEWEGGLYAKAPKLQSVRATAIPYYAWCNRGAGAMQVWIPTSPPPPSLHGLERTAEVSMSFVSDNCRPNGIKFGGEPKSSNEQPQALCHWWPHKGGEEWVQYNWEVPRSIKSAGVYFFDDTGRGECRLPATWALQWQDGMGAWHPIEGPKYDVAKDRWCEVTFTEVQTKSLRLSVHMQPGWAAGIRQWRVF